MKRFAKQSDNFARQKLQRTEFDAFAEQGHAPLHEIEVGPHALLVKVAIQFGQALLEQRLRAIARNEASSDSDWLGLSTRAVESRAK